MSKPTYRIDDVNADNIDDIGLVRKPDRQGVEGYQRKLAWVKDRFNEGLEYRVLLSMKGEKTYPIAV